MKIEDKLGGHIAPMGQKKYIQIIDGGRKERTDHFEDKAQMSDKWVLIGYKDVD
jgi:hypothetical protein